MTKIGRTVLKLFVSSFRLKMHNYAQPQKEILGEKSPDKNESVATLKDIPLHENASFKIKIAKIALAISGVGEQN
jgi:hypothetical protein